MNALRIKERPDDLLHVASVCTDTTNVVTKQYMGKGGLGRAKEGAMQCNAVLSRVETREMK